MQPVQRIVCSRHHLFFHHRDNLLREALQDSTPTNYERRRPRIHPSHDTKKWQKNGRCRRYAGGFIPYASMRYLNVWFCLLVGAGAGDVASRHTAKSWTSQAPSATDQCSVRSVVMADLGVHPPSTFFLLFGQFSASREDGRIWIKDPWTNGWMAGRRLEWGRKGITASDVVVVGSAASSPAYRTWCRTDSYVPVVLCLGLR
ncbi:hypothetical protein EJ05DRAFT_538595 [Pseudovirgaria hyperparasitica]|uniref:Uncharacterized protein n=1 Tax=Pseudovirgaria hyperparasitica TaxID=470096 RepID=A0A6A6W5C9_9PEZI|nr:uncharacterized protein EJ05DRAFT_538595 [Pseudovirgaria hyperparasitica]KAF2757379.1 hypothetical protein EJ05DRAFT_538595 [Pseudovirgaria hyperparasitica]